ncbi:hypothetical protein PG913_02400 [Tenacibaculum pacificus]|uniref:hypothetical protein n=1 Tax=Tenacibaculum TaxID=104267 RepID=UPI0022F3ED14|nr:hypothetical protein [Tenacibaculum pacificus]MDB0615159.1 hypothetical protein [Tenacibaculum dicentrarchi]WBX74109.1 hypothetical protein PG913_02400 [Tenacibaculum pacificus]
MKKALLLIAFIALGLTSVNAQKFEYKVITSVESTVPNGLGRSRLISSNEDRDYKSFTSTRSSEKKKDKRNKSDRAEIRVKNFDETKLLNFFNMGGIRFQNIVANDAVISSKINTMVEEGWDLAFVNSGVESYGGKGDKNGIFITRYIFKRLK